MLQLMLPMSFEGVDKGFPQLAAMKAIFLVRVIWVYCNLDGFPNHPGHVSHFGGEDGGVLKFNAVAQVDAVRPWLIFLVAPDGCVAGAS
jgi:hypothetical protein